MYKTVVVYTVKTWTLQKEALNSSRSQFLKLIYKKKHQY